MNEQPTQTSNTGLEMLLFTKQKGPCVAGRGVTDEPAMYTRYPYLVSPTHLQNLTRLSQLPVTSRMYTFSPSRDPKLLNGAQLTELQPSLESWMKVVCHSSFGWCCRILTRPSLEAHASIKPSSWGAHATLYSTQGKHNERGSSRWNEDRFTPPVRQAENI